MSFLVTLGGPPEPFAARGASLNQFGEGVANKLHLERLIEC